MVVEEEGRVLLLVRLVGLVVAVVPDQEQLTMGEEPEPLDRVMLEELEDLITSISGLVAAVEELARLVIQQLITIPLLVMEELEKPLR
jgi:hypothetical protein